MPTVWFVMQSNWRLIEAIGLAGWTVVSSTQSDLTFIHNSEHSLIGPRQSESQPRLKDVDVAVVDAINGGSPDVFQMISQLGTIPVLAVVGNWALAWQAIELGAEDVMIAPVSPVELLFRLRRLIHAVDLVQVGELNIDVAARRVKLRQRKIYLSPIEFCLLICLAKQIGKVVEYDRILDEVWESDSQSSGTLNQVKNCVRRLRQKIEPSPSQPQYIVSVRQVGYRLRNQTQWSEATQSQPPAGPNAR